MLYLGGSKTVAGRSFRQEGCSTVGLFRYCGSFVIQVGRLFYIWVVQRHWPEGRSGRKPVLQLDPSIIVGSWSFS